MNININQQPESKEVRRSCMKTFEVSGVQIQNSYLCGQPRFTTLDSWNLQKQKRQFPRRG